MPTGKTCGNCAYFIRVKGWGGGRNGLCDTFDFSCHSDSSCAKKCVGYAGKKYERRKHQKITIEDQL